MTTKGKWGGARHSTRPGTRGPLRLLYRLPDAQALELKLIAWGRYGRPTTAEETTAVLAALVSEEAQRIREKA
jgi:hypothetical protein